MTTIKVTKKDGTTRTFKYCGPITSDGNSRKFNGQEETGTPPTLQPAAEHEFNFDNLESISATPEPGTP